MIYTDASSTPAKLNRRTWRKKAGQYIALARGVRGQSYGAVSERFSLAHAARFCRRMAWRVPT
jgi:hypothetical protein